MGRYIFRIAAAVTAFFILFVGLRAIRTSRQQLIEASPTDPNDPVTFFIADGSGHTGYRSSDRELALWALQAWQRSVGKGLRFEATTESSTLVRVYWAEPEDGQFGEMRPLAVGTRRGAAVFIRPDAESLGPEIARRAQVDSLLRDGIVYLTCLHELGHALGLSHTQDFRDIMYYFGYGGDIVEYFERYRAQIRSRKDIASVSGLSIADVNRLRALYAQR